MIALVTGATGQLGFDLVLCLKERGYETLNPSRNELDFSDKNNVDAYFKNNKPDIVYHCGAWTAVDLAESEIQKCRKTNVDGTKYITEACSKLSIPILYVSTDYVFNGDGQKPWEIDDITDPVNEYGLSKRDGEIIVSKYPKHFIVRISWVFGINGKNFIKTMLSLAKKTDTVRVVNDQIGALTYTRDLSPLLIDITEKGHYGTYHAHNEGFCSWYNVAIKIFELSDIRMKIIPIPSSDYPLPAKRPLNSRLSMKSITDIGLDKLPRWEDALSRFLNEISNTND